MASTADYVGSRRLCRYVPVHIFEYFWSVTVPLSAENFKFESPVVRTDVKGTFNIAWKFVYSVGELGNNFAAKLLSIDNEEVDVFLNSYLINVLNNNCNNRVMEDKFYEHQSSVNCWEASFKDSRIYHELRKGSSDKSFQDIPLKFKIEFKVMELESRVKHALELSKNLGAFRSQGQSFSDVTFVVNKKEFQAHKTILVARSPVLATMLLGTDLREKRVHRIYVEEVDPDIFEQFLEFVYSARVDICGANDCDAWVELLIVAEKYGLEDLKESCRDGVARHLRTARFCVEDMTKIFAVPNLMNDEFLKQAAVNFVVRQEESVKESEAYKKLVEAHPFLLNEMRKF